jgi:Thioredoxin like C-terminal domain
MGGQLVASSTPGARIVNRFHARDLHLVMGPSRPGAPVRFRVTLDGRPPGPAHGGDVDESGNGTVVEQRLYQLIRQPGAIVDRQFEVEFVEAGVEAFAFTFG